MPAAALAMRKKPYEFRPSSENRAPESSGRGAQFPSARSLTRSLNHSAKTRLQRIRPKYVGASDDGHVRVALLGRSSRRGSPLHAAYIWPSQVAKPTQSITPCASVQTCDKTGKVWPPLPPFRQTANQDGRLVSTTKRRATRPDKVRILVFTFP